MDLSGDTMPTGPRCRPPEGTTRSLHPSDFDPALATVLPPYHPNFDEGQGTISLPTARHTMDVDKNTSPPSQSTEDIQREAKREHFRQIKTMQLQTPLEIAAEHFADWFDPSADKICEAAKLLHRGQCVAQAILGLNKRNDELAMESEDKKVPSEKTEEIAEISRQEQAEQLEGLSRREKMEMEVDKFFKDCLLDENGAVRKTQYSCYFQDDEVLKPFKKYTPPKSEDAGHLSDIPPQRGFSELQEEPCSNNPPVEYCMSDEFIERLDRQTKLCLGRMKEVSKKEIVANGLNIMNEEAFLAFRNYIAEYDLFEDFDYRFGEVLHHSFSVEEYGKVYWHYNFTIEMKKNNEERWSSSFYFAEAKVKHGVKYYFCSPLEVTDDGFCYSCKNQGVNMLKHPSGGGYHNGHEGSRSWYPNADSSDDDEDECGSGTSLFY